ncbi:hypothetical protein F4808DRAFT_358254 [Astrocystis sublimbata]|nr:hypothetical protein F4808DRAFT_358254 [Astrocystis sublimbata]
MIMRRPNFNDPGDQGLLVLEVTWTVTVLSIIVILLRIYVRIKLIRGLSLHDYFMIVATALQISSQACVTMAYYWGLGIHKEYLLKDPAMGWTKMLKWVYISTIPGVLCSITARISICLLLVGIFSNKVWFKWWLTVNTSLITVLGLLSIILTWVQTDPVEALWQPQLPTSRKWNPIIVELFGVVTGVIFALTDLTFVLFPVIIIWKLNMPLRRKMGLCVLLAGSIATVVLCVMRITTIPHGTLEKARQGVLWNSLEQSLVIILGSVPTLPAFRKIISSWSQSLSTSLASLADIMTSRRHKKRGVTLRVPDSRSLRTRDDDEFQLVNRDIGKEPTTGNTLL